MVTWNGQQYFIDDFYRYGYIYLLHEKSQSLDLLQILKLKLRSTQQKNKSIRSDSDGKYYNTYDSSGEQHLGLFAKFLKECGIIPQYTILCSPTMNGVIER